MEYSNDNPYEQARQLKQLEEMKRQILTKILSKEAFERLGRVRIANPELAGTVELYLVQLFQTGKLINPIDDDKLKEILRALSERKDFNIRRR